MELDEGPSSLSLRYRRRQWGAGCFMLLWLCGWTVGCLFLGWQVWQKPEPLMIAFVTPFWASWIFVFLVLLAMFLQHERLTLDENGVTYAKSIVFPIHSRFVPLSELLRFESSATTNVSEDCSPSFFVELVTVGQPLTMFSDLSTDERTWLTWRLNQQLASLKPGGATELEEETSPRSLPGSVEMPSDCSWQREDSYEGTTFVQRGRLNLIQLLGVLFVVLFWNGVVSVFVMVLLGVAPGGPRPFDIEWWGLCVFLIPFEVIGLILFGVLLFTVMEPVRRTSWRFDRDEIIYRLSWLGLGRSRRYDADAVDRIDLRIRNAGESGVHFSLNDVHRTTASRGIRLILIDRDNTEVVSINGITEGEGRWMMDCVKRDHPQWFR